MLPSKQYRSVVEEVADVCRQAGRDPREVQVIAVSKTVGLDEVASACEGGALDFGENRPDDLVRKHHAFPELRWHFIGNVQSRRIPDIVASAYLVHSVFKPEHLSKFNAAAQALGKVVDILIEVNISGEQSKGGVVPEEARELVCTASKLDYVQVRGLMTMAPQGDLVRARECFDNLRLLRDSLRSQMADDADTLSELSMGMSEDWHEAVLAGATMVRIGRAVFSSDFS